jgi:hypothetical protein
MNTRGADIRTQESAPRAGHVSKPAPQHSFIIAPDDRILVKGIAAFVTFSVSLRHRATWARIEGIGKCRLLELFKGNLLSRADCEAACTEVRSSFTWPPGRKEVLSRGVYELRPCGTRVCGHPELCDAMPGSF